MGKHYEVKEVHKWHYINIDDFQSRNCIAIFSYIWVWVLAITAVAVYVLDTFTAVKLLGFNQWSSKVEPVIDFKITKWIFAGCILFSWVLCFYEWFRAWRVMRKKSVTEDYLDPLAVVLQSIRIPGGWRRFLVFAELTKSKKKAAWVAIFVYFQRKGAIRLLAAEGPRMVLNGITLYSVARSKFVEGPHDDGDSLFISFFKNIRKLYMEDDMQAFVLSSMAFTLLVWVIYMIFLIAALLFWIFFIAHYVNKETLTGYCRRKVETRLSKIVKEKTDRIFEQEQRLKGKDAKKKLDADALDAMKRQPTLPVFASDSPPKKPDSFFGRSESVSTLPLYTSQPTTPAEDYLPRMPLARNDTDRFSPNAGLLDNAGAMGQNGSYHRPGTSSSNRSYSSRNGSYTLPPLSTPSNDPRMPPSVRSSPMSAAERRYSPPGSNPWRTPVDAVSEQNQEYELQQAAVPSALRPAMGPRRDMSSPGPGRGPMSAHPQRSFTDGPAGLPRSMTPGGPPPSRSMTPASGPPSRTMTPAGLPSSLAPSIPRSHTPGDPMRSQTPGMVQSMRPMGNSMPGGWGGGPGSGQAF